MECSFTPILWWVLSFASLNFAIAQKSFRWPDLDRPSLSPVCFRLRHHSPPAPPRSRHRGYLERVSAPLGGHQLVKNKLNALTLSGTKDSFYKAFIGIYIFSSRLHQFWTVLMPTNQWQWRAFHLAMFPSLCVSRHAGCGCQMRVLDSCMFLSSFHFEISIVLSVFRSRSQTVVFFLSYHTCPVKKLLTGISHLWNMTNQNDTNNTQNLCKF